MTPEQILEAKKKAFEENPDNFVSIDELIIAARRNGTNIGILVAAATRVELETSLMRLTHACFGVFNAMSYAQQQASKPKIQMPGGIMNFARNRLKK